MKSSHTQKWLIGLLMAGLVYGAFWLVTAHTVRARAEQWAKDQEARGLIITAGEPALAGFPTRIAVTFPNLRLRAQGWSWEAEDVTVAVTPLSLTHPIVDVSGRHTATGFTENPLTLSVKHGDVTWNGEDLALHLANLDADIGSSPFGADTVTATFTPIAAAATSPAPTLRAQIAVTNLALADAPAPLAHTIPKLDLTAELDGTLARGTLTHVLESWRDAGGDVELRAIAVDWPPLSLNGSGTLALDKALQPMGAFTAKCRGFLETLDALVKSGHVQENEAAVVRGLLVLMAKTSTPDAAPEIDLSVTVQDRKVTAGPVTFMELPTIDWRKDFLVP